jgi:spermidine/putrescine transport system substrate-binding protein/spermidine/putrescine transport system permease protein
VNLRRHPISAGLSALVIGFLWLPLVVVIIGSFDSNSLLTTWTGATVHWYHLALNDPNVRSGLETTLIIAVLSALLSLAVALTGALWWRRAPHRARAVYDGLVYSRIVVPEVVFASALFFLFLKIHFALGLPAIVVGHAVLNSAYATLVIQARLIGLDPALEEAAADLGATPWRAFRRVTLITLMPAIIAAGLLAFTFSLDDVVTSYFLQGTSQSPLPIVLLGMIRFRITPEINAVGVFVMFLTVALMSAAVAVLATAGRVGRSGRRSRLTGLYEA